MRRAIVTGAVALLVGVAGCGSTGPGSPLGEDPVGRALEPIQGGANDITHDFAVAVVQVQGSSVAICSGVLLAPNLVATARHCVSRLASTQIDCTTSSFAGTLPASDMFVTTTANLSTAMSQSDFDTVVAGTTGSDGIIVPPDAGVCGNDIALLILTQPISIPQYVTPSISPPMTDQQAYTAAFTAIGYGVDTPTDTSGATAGVRRIRQNISIACIPNDPLPAEDCFRDPAAQEFISAKEFEGGDGTCEGDSGSGAFDQGSFNAGSWVAFGVLSRGGISPEGGTCEGSIYTRFDAWGPLIISAANQAAAMGGYSPPSWTVQTVQPTPDASSGVPGCFTNGATCSQDSDCCTVNCIAYGTVAGTCFTCDPSHACAAGNGCRGGVCVPGATDDFDAGSPTTTTRSSGGGCAVAAPGPGESGLPWPALAVGLGLAATAAGRRRRLAGQDSEASE